MEKNTADHIITQVAKDYDTISAHFAHTRKNQWYEVSYLTEQYLGPGDRVLDLGCGSGRVADLVDAVGAHYVGMDISSDLITIAQQQRSTHEFSVGNMMATGFDDNSFDHLLMIASFHHIPGHDYRVQTLQEAKRIVKPGGNILMTNWNLHQWKFRSLRRKFNRIQKTEEHPMDRNDLLIPWYDQQKQLLANRYYHGFTISELKELAEEVGLHVVDQYYETHGMHVRRYKGQNIVTILQK